MNINKVSRIFVFILLALLFATATFAQKDSKPYDLSVAGVKLGDRESAKKFLEGFQPRTDDGKPTYYFYNSRITSVLKLTATSFEDPYFLTELEVFSVGESYQAKHFVAEKLGHFVSESGVFVGFRQSGGGLALALMVGVPNVARNNKLGPKDIVKMKGEPIEQKTDGETVIYDYRSDDLKLPGSDVNYKYTAKYQFRNKSLKRFSMQIEPSKKTDIAKQ